VSLTDWYVEISSPLGLSLAEAYILKAPEEDKTRVGILTFEKNKPTGGVAGTPCDQDGVAVKDFPKGKRPTCNTGLCCGYAWDKTDKNKATTVETCQPEASTAYTYKPKWDSIPVEWQFECIQGAKALAISSAAVLAAMFVNL